MYLALLQMGNVAPCIRIMTFWNLPNAYVVLSFTIQMICGPVFLAVMDYHFIMQANRSLWREPAGRETTD